MNINIGENIKNLRKRKDITQEELAEHLGISFQSISKWERGDGFPDITMLPDLADFFNISIDDLIGADRISGGELSDIYVRAYKHENDGKYDEAVNLLRETLQKYPNHFDMTSKLSSLLLFLDKDSKEGKELAKKAVILCERKLDGIMSEKARASARAMLCFLYENIGEHEKANDLASKLPHVWESREILWGEFKEGQEYIDYLKRWLILPVLSVINDKIASIADNSKKINAIDMLFMSPPCDKLLTPENRNEIINKIINFLDS